MRKPGKTLIPVELRNVFSKTQYEGGRTVGKEEEKKNTDAYEIWLRCFEELWVRPKQG